MHGQYQSMIRLIVLGELVMVSETVLVHDCKLENTSWHFGNSYQQLQVVASANVCVCLL